VVAIDILYLVDRLENALNTGQRVPFTNKIMVDERECLDIVDQMRIVVPEEIKQARRVSQDRDRITGQAQEEAERILSRAHEQAEQLMDDQGLLDRAREREQEIVEEAEQQAQEIREQADQYAYQILDELNRLLGPILSQVQAGIDSLRPRQTTAPLPRASEVREREPVPADVDDADEDA
jgi:dsDNA-specific endonuclease/ATPase MutS2